MRVESGDGSLSVERIPPHDWRQLRDIRLEALESEPDAFGASWQQDRGLTPAQWRATLAANRWLRASTGPTTVRAVVAFFPNDLEPDGAPQLGSMWVRHAYRRTGLARLLCAAVAAHARENGVQSLGLWVVDGNDAAASVYRQLGFRITGDEKPAPRDRTITMRRMLLRL